MAMATMRFNHMELTFGEGQLTPRVREEITAFYEQVFGWSSLDVEVLGQKALLLGVDEEVSQFVLVAENPKPMSAPGYDHLGVLLETRTEVDELLDRCRAYREQDERVRIKEYDDLDQGVVVVHAFYVKYLLPIWLDVQCMEWRDGCAPGRRWTYG
jgi:hypothetical protein